MKSSEKYWSKIKAASLLFLIDKHPGLQYNKNMPKNKTDKRPYLSSYGGEYVRADQWVTEKLCALIAKKSGSELPDKFWKLPEWSKIFGRQVQLAASVLLIYDAEALAKSLKDKRMKNLNSFAALKSENFFSRVVDEYQSLHDVEVAEQKNAKEIHARDTSVLPNYKQKDNRLSRLKNIDVETRPVQSG